SSTTMPDHVLHLTLETAGQKLYDEVHLSIDNLLSAKQVLFDDEQNLKGILRISAPPAFSPVLSWIGEFQQKFPNVQIHVTMTERILDLSADGIDVAFRIGDLHGDNFIAKKVLTIGTKWVGHPKLLARFGAPQTVQDLSRFPLAAWAKNNESKTVIQMGKEKTALPFLFASNDICAVEYMILQGKAIGQISDFTANQWISEQRLVEILPGLEKPDFDVFMLYASQRYPSAIVRKFVEFVLGDIHAA
ncbi:MAG: substrate binding domain-containing protein, partial [Lautropia sp.]|nr:substrate binding domain-containing protein [Lautropia sp.]